MQSLPDVVSTFEQIVKESKDKGLSLDDTLKKLKEQYESNLIDIKTELHDHFEIFAFQTYLSGTDSIDQYIDICNKLENSQSELERNNNETLIQHIINGVKADCENYGEKEADVMAILTVRNEVDKIRALCRENKKRKDIYEKYKTEIMSIQKTSENPKEPQEILYKEMPPRIQKMFKDKIITGYKINSRWIVNNEKHGIKELMDWAENNNLVFQTPYIVNTFCRQNGKPFTNRSINTYRSKNGLTGSCE
jgi:hypothetical protein